MEGSIFKRCNSCSHRVQGKRCEHCGTRNVSWGFVVGLGYDADGKRLQKLRSGFNSKGQAEDALRDLLSSLDRGGFVEARDLTVGDYLTKEWLPASGPPRVSYETWVNRRMYIRSYIAPRVGKLRLQQLGAAHLNRLYAALLREGRVRGEGGLSATSVRRVHSILRVALNDAVRWGLLSRNPVEAADPPPMRAVRAAWRASMTTWTAQELARFLRQVEGEDLFPLWLFAAMTGVRRSELLAVRWADLDLDTPAVVVRQTVLNGEAGPTIREQQKSETSARTIHLDRRTARVLETLKAKQARHRQQVGGVWQDHDLVFCREDGRWYHPDSISTAFRQAVARGEVPRIRLHDLRHTHATLLLQAGVHPKIVSERLGHSSVSFTLETYAHVLPGMQAEAAELLADFVLGETDEEGKDDQAPAGDPGDEPEQEDQNNDSESEEETP